MKLWNYLKNYMLSFPDQTVSENDAKLTFEQLVIWAENFSKKMDKICSCAICCNSEMAAAMSLLACFAAGVTAVPISMRYGIQHGSKILNFISPQAIITDFEGHIELVTIKDNEYVMPKRHPALIMCTSGTTGDPKGVMLSENNIITNVNDIGAYFEIKKDDNILIFRCLYHCAVLTGEFLTSLTKGCSIRFLSGRFDPVNIIRLVSKYNISVLCGTPTLFNLLTKIVKKDELSTLKKICVSGECLDYETGIRMKTLFCNCDIYHVYGLTEACPRVSYLPPYLFGIYPDYVGIPLNSVDIKLVNEHNQNCQIGEEGTIWVKGNNIMMGYYKDEKKSNSVLKEGWLCTGDIGIINSNGLLKIKGRKDDLIIKAGMNIYPGDIEASLKKDKRVKEVFAYGFNDTYSIQIGLNISGDFKNKKEVKELCLSLLPIYQVPKVINLLNELPKNESGKIIRKA